MKTRHTSEFHKAAVALAEFLEGFDADFLRRTYPAISAHIQNYKKVKEQANVK